MALAAALLTACAADEATDDGGDGQRCALTINLGTDDLSIVTRASTDPNAETNEQMWNAAVALCKDGTVLQVYQVSTKAEEFQSTQVGHIEVDAGDYTFYSFANFGDGIFNADKTQFTISAGGQDYVFANNAAVPSGLSSAVIESAYNGYALSKDNAIRMTNVETFTVEKNQTITLHVYRLAAKIRFQFTNNSSRSAAVDGITLGQVTDNATNVNLLPVMNGSISVPTFDGITGHTLSDYQFYDGSGVTDGSNAMATGEARTFGSYYLNESVTQHASGHFPLTVGLTYTDTDGVTKSSVQRFSLLSISSIGRNNFVTVPVILTDYVVGLDVQYYPPIGGYPAYSLDEKNDELYATFTGAGDFVLVPHAYRSEDAGDASKWFELTDKSKVVSYSLFVDDAAGLFSTAPHFASTGEILGTIQDGASGTATVRLTVNFRVSDTVTQTYARTIYIVVQ